MINQELRDYVSTCRGLGQTDEHIRKALAENGWSLEDIHGVLAEKSDPLVPQPVSLPKISYVAHFSNLFPLAIGSVLSGAMLEYFGYWSRVAMPQRPLVIIAAIILGIVAIFYALWFSLSTAFYVARSSEGRSAAMNHALQRIPAYLWIAVLMMLIIQLGNMLLIIPGIIFAVWFSFSSFVLAQEDVRGLNTLLKSKEYVRGHWWRVFGTLLALAVGAIVLIGFGLGALSIIHGTFFAIAIIIVFCLALALYVPFVSVTYYNLFARIKNEKGIVALPKKGRGLFATLAVLGLFVPLFLGLIFASTIRHMHFAAYGAQSMHHHAMHHMHRMYPQDMNPQPPATAPTSMPGAPATMMQ